MREFMDLVETAFYEATSWSPQNSYRFLTTTSDVLLNFRTPAGLSLSLASLATPHYATSYKLVSSGPLSGSLSYLYTSPHIQIPPSKLEDLTIRIPAYQYPHDLPVAEHNSAWEIWKGGRRIDRRDVMLSGQLFLPGGRLHAMYLRRSTPTTLVRIAALSEGPVTSREDGLKSKASSQGSIIGSIATDTGKYSYEGLYSTAGGLIGLKGLWNFGFDPRTEDRSKEGTSRISAGGELYYGVLNKSGGASTGIRYATLPNHSGIPITMTLTLNPLMGHISATYATKANDKMSMATQFDFNTYSYESDVVLGCEIWRQETKSVDAGDKEAESVPKRNDFMGVFKANWRQSTGAVNLLWEGRIKSLIFSIGTRVEFTKGGDSPFKALGVAVAYSS